MTRDVYQKKGELWGAYRAILDRYGPDEEIGVDDNMKLDRIDVEFRGVEAYFNQVDPDKRLPLPGLYQDMEISREGKQFNAALRGEVLERRGRVVPEAWRGYTQAKAALAEVTGGSGATGGFLTPDIYLREFINKKYQASFVRQAPVRTIKMTSDVMRVPTIGTASTAAILTAEGAAFSEVEPTVAEVEYRAYKYTRIQLASEELVADANFDVLREVVMPDQAQSFAAAENTAFTTGTGSSQPQGIVTGATNTQLGAGNMTAVTTDQVMTHFHRLGVQYRGAPSAGWMMNDSTILAMRQLKDSTNQYLWQPGLQAGQPDTLLGKRVYANNSMAALGTSNKFLLFGDFQYYAIGDRLPLAINTLVERYAELGQIAFRGQARFDSHVLIAEAIQSLQNSAT